MKRCRYEIHLFLQRLLVAWKYPYTAIARDTSNGGYRRGEKSCKHWSLFTMLSSLVIANLFVRLNKTRPDTRLPKSRAGGQGPYWRSPDHLGRSSGVKKKS